MRVLALALVLAGTALPVFAVRDVTVEQLEKTLAQNQGKSDSELARQLLDLQLNERLGSTRLVRLEADLPGEKSRQALVVLADASAFLEPPASEIPGTATPGSAAQRRMAAQAVAYLGKSLPLLPNLFATRDTTRFESRSSESGDISLHPVGRTVVTVLYRDNQEFIEAAPRKADRAEPPERGLTTWGEFGPILGTVFIDAARSNLIWSHWELGAAGPQAVFRYTVPREKSHYDLRFCCVASSYGLETNLLRQRAGYHGEITLDPSTGAILRITLIADLDAGNPISRASMAVEYGAVEIGGRSYVCPVRGIALAEAPSLKAIDGEIRSEEGGSALPPLNPVQKTSLTIAAHAPHQAYLNDIAFRAYHLYRTDVRVVPEKELVGRTAELSSANPEPGVQPPSEDKIRPASELAPTAPATPTANGAPAETAAAEPPSIPAPGAAPEPVLPEISVSEAAGIPQSPVQTSPATAPGGFTIRMNSRLVDISVVALDKKGHPIGNLKPEDFEIYDNGVKQDVRSFEQAGVAPAASAGPQTAPAAGEQPSFSNRKVSQPGNASADNTIVLLVDGSNLAFNDLVDAREQMVRFLRALPAGQRAALYSMKSHGFQVLVEPSQDHEALAVRLAKWMPEARDLANANDEEQRNRQQIETVHSPEDLLSVNGNYIADTDSQSEALDPKLRPMGSNAPRDALSILVDVARHLAAVDGHKSLIWVTSDNALASWNQSQFTMEQHAHFVEPAALRVQEAMNNAHVSVYPLDASRLEAAVIGANIGNRNVELTPTYQMPQYVEHQIEGPEAQEGPDLNAQIIADRNSTDLRSTRLFAQMQQDMHPIQGVFREVAAATGGQAFRRSNNVIGELNSVVADGRATYQLGFSPSIQADGKYHVLTVKLVNHKDSALRYRSGYQYDKEPADLKDRFMKAVWQPADIGDVTVSATPSKTDASMLKLNIAATDLALAQDGDLWTDRIDVFLVRRDDSGLHAKVSGQTLTLRLKSETYQKYLRDGVLFDEMVGARTDTSSVRIVVVDENAGRMGSITIPAAVLEAMR